MKRAIIASSVILFSAAGLLLVGQAPTLPGTSVDRIGFPKDYQTTFTQLYVFDNDANRQVRVVWANDIAMTVEVQDLDHQANAAVTRRKRSRKRFDHGPRILPHDC